MNNYYENTIKKMIYSNEELEKLLFEDESISLSKNKIINIELFFLTFNLFKEYLDKTDIDVKWKNMIKEEDYIIKGDRIFIGDEEISYQLLEIAFINTLFEYKKEKDAKIIKLPVIKSEKELPKYDSFEIIDLFYEKDDKVQTVFTSDQFTEEIYEEDAIKQLNSYTIEDCDSIAYYLNSIKSNFRNIAFDSILNTYNLLKKYRKNVLFKNDLSLINDNSTNDIFYKDLIIFLLRLYPIQFYSKDKIEMKYENLELPNVEVDANHYRYDDEWTRVNEEYETINQRIEYLTKYKKSFKSMSPRDYKKLPFVISTLEMKRTKLLEKLLDLSLIREHEIVEDDECLETYYSGELYNKHILYNLEVALNNGHVDIRKKYGKDVIIFYAIVDEEVDYILEVEIDKIKDVIDNMCLIDSIEQKEKVLRTN